MVDTHIRGVIVPVVTPLTPDETVDHASLRRLIDYVVAGGVHGIWASGTTGEFASLTDGERLDSVETVVDQAAGRVPVIANVSGPSTQLTVNLGLAVRGMGLAGIGATPPFYYPSGQDEVLTHYRKIRERTGMPLWVYNIPSTVKTAVLPDTIARLAAEGAIVGVKDSSGAGEALAELKVRCEQEGIALYRFLGTAFRITTARAVGAHGVIPGIANVLPEAAARGWEAGERGDDDACRECDAKLLLATALQRIPHGGSEQSARLATMKAALKIMGIIDHDTMSSPMRGLTLDEKAAIPPILDQLGLTRVASRARG